MGQKVNPIIARIGTTKTWSSSWFVPLASYKNNLKIDAEIRKFFFKVRKEFQIFQVSCKFFPNKVVVLVLTAKPGIFVKNAMGGIGKITQDLKHLTGLDVKINVGEAGNMSSSSAIAISIAKQIEARSSHTKAAKRAVEDFMKQGGKGIKISIAGRIGGAEMARTDVFTQGNLPLSTLKNDIDYALETAVTVYGVIGVRVWLFGNRKKYDRN